MYTCNSVYQSHSCLIVFCTLSYSFNEILLVFSSLRTISYIDHSPPPLRDNQHLHMALKQLKEKSARQQKVLNKVTVVKIVALINSLY